MRVYVEIATNENPGIDAMRPMLALAKACVAL